MKRLTFPYITKTHPIWGTITYPFITVDFYATPYGQWLKMNEVLVDTGADLSIVPRHLGQALVPVIETGIPIRLGGSISRENGPLEAFIHSIPARIHNLQFNLPLAIVHSLAVPVILGRREALDRFSVQFVKGKEVIIELE